MSVLAIDLAWLAGVFEGEGSIFTSSRGSLTLSMMMTDEDTITRCHRIAGVGTVCGPYRNGSYKPTWAWRVQRQADAAALLMTLYPLLGLRRQEKARECLATWRSVELVGYNKPKARAA